MASTVQHIDVVASLIAVQFHHHGIHRSSCLAQSFILYKFIRAKLQLPATLVKGYIVNHKLSSYYGHFWVEYNGRVLDPATESYLMDYKAHHRDNIRTHHRTLMRTLPDNIIAGYATLDNPEHESTREHSYRMCLDDNFLQDVKNKAGSQIHQKIKTIYDAICT